MVLTDSCGRPLLNLRIAITQKCNLRCDYCHKEGEEISSCSKGTLEEMAVEASLTGDPTMVFHAIAYDPLTAAVLSLAEIKEMVNEMFHQNRDHLPQFKHFAV